MVGAGPGGAGGGAGVLEVGVVKLSLLTQKSGRYLDVIKMGAQGSAKTERERERESIGW